MTGEQYSTYCMKSASIESFAFWLYNTEHIPLRRLNPLTDFTANDAGVFPVYCGDAADLPIELLIACGHANEQMDFLCWCHETAETNIDSLPALQMVHKLGWKACLPLALGQQGSLAFVSAIDLMSGFLDSEDKERCCLIAADCTKPPFERFFYSAFPKGDAAVVSILTRSPGAFQVMGTRFALDCLPTVIHDWDFRCFEAAEHNLIRLAGQLATDTELSGKSPDWVIVQNLSEAFVQGVADLLRNANTRLYARKNWARANLLNGDPLVSLYGLEQSGELRQTDRVRLIFASFDYGAAAIELQKLV